MLSVFLLGIFVSVFTELATLINKKINGTVLQGKAAYFMALAIAVVFAVGKTLLASHPTWSVGLASLAGIYTSSEIFFNVILTTVGLTVSA